MVKHFDILSDPPEDVLGTQDPEHESNLTKDKSGSLTSIEEKHRGGCVLLAILNATEQRNHREEAELRKACRMAMDEVKAGRRPFTRRQAADLLYRLHQCAEKLSSQSAEAVCDAEDYLVAYLGGEKAVEKFYVLWDVKKPKDPKVTDRIRQEDEILKELEEAERKALAEAVEVGGAESQSQG